jgi:RNA polymerase sigma-70 factor (ECF subfamily)
VALDTQSGLSLELDTVRHDVRGARPALHHRVPERISVDLPCHLCYTDAQPFPPAGVVLCETGGRLRGLRVSESVDEVALVEQAKIDPYAFGLLYERYVDKIYNYVYYRTGNHHDAEDLTAKVFYQALNHIPRFVQRGAPFSSWLYRIAHNLVANWHRDRSRKKVVSLDRLALVGAEGDDGPFQQTAQGERRDAVLAAVRCLPADRQELLILKFVEQLPNAQIGQIMGRSEGAIKSLYHRTLVGLREDLTDRLL